MALFSVIALGVAGRAMGQTTGASTPDALSNESVLAAESDTRPSLTEETPEPLPGPRGRPFVNALFAIPLVTFAGRLGPRGSEILSPADRLAITQLIGAGYVVNPRFRFGVMGIFTEAFTGVPPGGDALQFGAVAPVAIGTFGHFIIGGGPLIAYRTGGTFRREYGAVMLSGASIPLKRGLALNIVAPVPVLFTNRRTASVAVAVGVAKVF